MSHFYFDCISVVTAFLPQKWLKRSQNSMGEKNLIDQCTFLLTLLRKSSE